MEQAEYNKLYRFIKCFNQKKIECAKNNTQKIYNAHSLLNSSIKFRIVQNRKSYRHKDEKNKVSYVILHNGDLMMRVDYNGQTHKGVPTPHMHIYDDLHSNGGDAIPISAIDDYDNIDEKYVTDQIVNSFAEFLKYNNFDITKIVIENTLI